MKNPHIAQKNINETKAASLKTGVVEIVPAPVHHVEFNGLRLPSSFNSPGLSSLERRTFRPTPSRFIR